MKINEVSCAVDRTGTLTLSRELIGDMGLKPEDKISIAYIASEDNPLHNAYKEFFISPDGIMAPDIDQEVGSICIPDSLLESAGIPQDSDVVINCGSGVITITANDSIEEEVRQTTSLLAAINQEMKEK